MTNQTLRRIEHLEAEMLSPQDTQKIRITVRFVDVDGVLVPTAEPLVFEVPNARSQKG